MFKKTDVELVNLFPTFMLECHVDPRLADQIEDILTSEIDGMPTEQTGSLHTDYFTDERIDIKGLCPKLYKEMEKAKDHAVDITTFKATNEFDAWVQDYRDDKAVHPRHQHGISGISGVYWVRANEGAGPLIFYNPDPTLDYVAAEDWFNPYRTTIYEYMPKKGMMLLFPSYLQHEVMPSLPNVVRTTIAFNFISPDHKDPNKKFIEVTDDDHTA
jgi:hypothetical protein